MSQHFSKGFSLAELIVTISIVSIILTVILMGQSRYTAGASLNANLGAATLTVRQAQTYGISVRQFLPGVEEFNIGYGVSFRVASVNGSNEYIFYADRGSSDLNKYSTSDWNTCTIGGTSECLGKTVLTGSNVIWRICYQAISGTEQCSSDRRVDITFTRPETSVSMRFFNSSGGSETVVANLEYARVIFRSTITLTEKSIYVYPTGQISAR